MAVIPGFPIFGGWKWMIQHKGKMVDIDRTALKQEPFTRQQWFTVAGTVALIVLVIVPARPGMEQFLFFGVVRDLSDRHR